MYTADEIAERLGLSRDTVSRIFEKEPGVVVIDNRGRPWNRPWKRRYRTLRIPESVFERVSRRLSNPLTS